MKRLTPNSIKNVTPNIIQEPHRIDLVVKGLQSAFNALTWNEKSFGRAVIMSTKRDKVNYTYPGMFVSNSKDYLNMMEQDNFNAYSFFVAHDSESVEDYQEGVRNSFRRRLSAIFWLNLERIDATKDHNQLLEELKEDVLGSIRTVSFERGINGGIVSGIQINSMYDEPANIFEGFTFNLNSQFLYNHYRGLRIDLDCFYEENC